MELSEYDYVRYALERTPCNAEILDHLKLHFQSDIQSERCIERINSIKKLIRILEKRDCLNLENVVCFYYIASKIPGGPDIATLVNTYRINRNSVEISPPNVHQNYYSLTPPPLQPALADLPLDPINRVDDLICSDIGQKWKDFARALRIREGKIDDLEARHRSIYERVREILRYHRQNVGEQHWRRKLCDALDAARRRDLHQEVQSIFAEHYM